MVDYMEFGLLQHLAVTLYGNEASVSASVSCVLCLVYGIIRSAVGAHVRTVQELKLKHFHLPSISSLQKKITTTRELDDVLFKRS
jgi:hypothetical protein